MATQADANPTPQVTPRHPRAPGGAPVFALPKPKRRGRTKITAAARRRIEDAVERLIEVLDAVEAPLEDLEDDSEDEDREGPADEDDEPSLGSTEAVNQARAWHVSFLQANHPDGEPSLGQIEPELSVIASYNYEGRWVYSPPGVNQTTPLVGGAEELEEEHDGCEPPEDDEPSLGSSEPLEMPSGARCIWNGVVRKYTTAERADVYNQTNWVGFTSCGSDLEHDDADNNPNAPLI
jgi:hypothetical protein